MSTDPILATIANAFLKAAGPEPAPDPEIVALQSMSMAELKAAYGEAILECEKRKHWHSQTCVLYVRARQAYVDAPTDENMTFILSAEHVKEEARTKTTELERREWHILDAIKAKQQEEGA